MSAPPGRARSIEPGAVVIAHLVNPTEKLWGVLDRLDTAGAVLRGISLTSFEDWMREVASDDEPSLGLSTLFVPLARVERIYLDEGVGQVESYRERFEQRVGRSIEAYLDLG